MIRRLHPDKLRNYLFLNNFIVCPPLASVAERVAWLLLTIQWRPGAIPIAPKGDLVEPQVDRTCNLLVAAQFGAWKSVEVRRAQARDMKPDSKKKPIYVYLICSERQDFEVAFAKRMLEM